MKRLFARNYVPGEDFLLDKEEMPCRRCYEDFAVASFSKESVRIVAGRGKLTAGTELRAFSELPATEKQFLQETFFCGKTAAIAIGDELFLLYPQNFRLTGLVGILHPYATATQVRDAVLRLPEVNILLSPCTKALKSKTQIPEGLCERLMEAISYCNVVFFPSKGEIRLLVAKTAWFCGCKTNLLSLPAEDLPTTNEAFCKFLMFLLCFFLAVSGVDEKGPHFTVSEICNKEMQISAFQNTPNPKNTADFSFLELPCFSNISLHKKKKQFTLQITLPIKEKSLVFHADSACFTLTVYFVQE